MTKDIVKDDIQLQKDSTINYIVKNGQKTKYEPWLEEVLTFTYDWIMKNKVFPGRLSADFIKHDEINRDLLGELKNKRILELGTGSGRMSKVLDRSNYYVGVDISRGLLKKASKRFSKGRFSEYDLFLASAIDLPFKEDVFDFGICNLSFNFFPDIGQVISEIRRTLSPNGKFFCSVPVPERKRKEATIHGTLLSEEELKTLFFESGFRFNSLPYLNGAILYFIASY